MTRLKTRLMGAVVVLCAAGTAMPAAAVDPAGDCPSHGVLLDAAALCDPVLLPLRPLVDSESGRDAAAQKRTGLFMSVRAIAPRASAPADDPRPLVVSVQPDAPTARAALRHAADDKDSR